MDRRQFNAFAGQTLIALFFGTATTKHSCTEPDCIRCNKAAEAKRLESLSD